LDGLTQAVLRELGGEIQLFPGLPDFFPTIKKAIEEDEVYKKFGITIEHYCASTGLLEMIRGSPIWPHMAAVEACEFDYDADGRPIEKVYEMTHAEKTGALARINKGVHCIPEISVNSVVPPDKRYIPFENMVGFGDGPSDVPWMSMMLHKKDPNKEGGYRFAVFNSDPTMKKYELNPAMNAMALHQQGRADFVVAGDYRVGSPTYRTVYAALRRIADRIVREIESDLVGAVQAPPGH